jgi:hypothetical protein
MHNYGLTVDVVPYLSGESGDLNWHANTEQFQAMVAALKAPGLAWGGDWIHFKDEDHFQVPDVPANPSDAMVADYGDGGLVALQNIWMNSGDGKYSA